MASQQPADYYTFQRPELTAFLWRCGRFQHALDIGCAAGVQGEQLLAAGLVNQCDGIEPYAEAAQQAKQRLQRVWTGRLEDVIDQVPWSSYDLIIMADVLEHLVDPWTVLRHLHTHSAPGCRLLLSVPNVRHYKVVLPLLLHGQFRYTDSGIMDRTHLHFYTWHSLVETLEDCGWQVALRDSHMKSRYRRWWYPTRLMEPFVAVQYLLLAEKR